MAGTRWHHMLSRLVLIYAVVELAAFVALVSTIGLGWSMLVLLATFALGILVWIPMAGRRLSAQILQLQSGLKQPGTALGDGASLTLATALLIIPGLVTSAVGLLLLAPPVRTAAGSRVAAILLRRIQVRAPLIAAPAAGPSGGGRDYIDGEVIDVRYFEPAALPDRRSP
jgi:UPF0716 protein FxsA